MEKIKIEVKGKLPKGVKNDEFSLFLDKFTDDLIKGIKEKTEHVTSDKNITEEDEKDIARDVYMAVAGCLTGKVMEGARLCKEKNLDVSDYLSFVSGKINVGLATLVQLIYRDYCIEGDETDSEDD